MHFPKLKVMTEQLTFAHKCYDSHQLVTIVCKIAKHNRPLACSYKIVARHFATNSLNKS